LDGKLRRRPDRLLRALPWLWRRRIRGPTAFHLGKAGDELSVFNDGMNVMTGEGTIIVAGIEIPSTSPIFLTVLRRHAPQLAFDKDPSFVHQDPQGHSLSAGGA
jgi:hypothetical protein